MLVTKTKYLRRIFWNHRTVRELNFFSLPLSFAQCLALSEFLERSLGSLSIADQISLLSSVRTENVKVPILSHPVIALRNGSFDYRRLLKYERSRV